MGHTDQPLMVVDFKASMLLKFLYKQQLCIYTCLYVSFVYLSVYYLREQPFCPNPQVKGAQVSQQRPITLGLQSQCPLNLLQDELNDPSRLHLQAGGNTQVIINGLWIVECDPKAPSLEQGTKWYERLSKLCCYVDQFILSARLDDVLVIWPQHGYIFISS